MGILTTVAEALHLLGKAIDPQAITKVHFDFDHSPSDLPGQVIWKFKATLLGSKEIGDEGAEIAFKQEWVGEGTTEEEALSGAHKIIVEHLQSFLQLRQEEAKYAEQAMMTACSQQPDLASMWPAADPVDQGTGG